MNFLELGEVIRYIRQNIPCASCKSSFARDSFSILGCMPMECMLGVVCYGCNAQAILIVTISISQDKNTSQRSIDIHVERGDSISKNDILDIKNFLKNFEGDFSELFK